MMNKSEYLDKVVNHLMEALHIYICARNQDAGLRDEKIEKTLRLATKKVCKQREKLHKQWK